MCTLHVHPSLDNKIKCEAFLHTSFISEKDQSSFALFLICSFCRKIEPHLSEGFLRVMYHVHYSLDLPTKDNPYEM